MAMRAIGAGEYYVQRWLKRKRAITAVMSVFSAGVLLILAILVLSITFFFVFALLWFVCNFGISALSELIVGRRWHVPDVALAIAGVCFIGFLFIQNSRVAQDDWTNYTLPRTPWSDLWVTGVTGSLLTLLLNANASSRMIRELLLTGPRLTIACLRALHRFVLVVRADLQDCSRAVALLIAKRASISTTDLHQRLGIGDPDYVMSLLAWFGAILFIRKEPPTIVLNPDLREQFRILFGTAHQPKFEAAREPEPPPESDKDRALHELLGLTPPVSLEDLRAAYRREMKQWHPDIFAGASEQERKIAEERTKAIIAAYEVLLVHYQNLEAKSPVAS